MTFIVTPLVGFGSVTPFKSAAFVTTAEDASDLTVYTFSTQSIGVAVYDRRIHVGVHGGGTGATTLTSVTVGGIAATINVQASQGNQTTAIVTAHVPTGTTADVVVTFSGAKARAAIGIFRSTGLVSNVAVDTDSSLADPGTATISTVAGGFSLSCATGDSGGPAAWTNVTELYDEDVDTTMLYTGAASGTTGANLSPSIDYLLGNVNVSAVFTSW